MKTFLNPLLFSLFSLLFLSCGSSSSQPVAPASPNQTAVPAGNLERQTLESLNRFRRQQGLPPVKNHPGLAQLARTHSNNMQKRNEMSHFDFKKRLKTAQRKYGMTTVAENIQSISGTVPTGSRIVDRWQNSPPHRKNMAGDYQLAGVGITQAGGRTFSTLLLGR